MNLLRAKFNHFCTFKPGYPGMNFGRFVCEAYGEGKTSRPADVTDLGYQIVSGGGRVSRRLQSKAIELQVRTPAV